MDKVTYRGFKVGDRVTVKQTEGAYDKVGDITPDMVGTIKAFPPKVRMAKGPLFDTGYYFAYIEFDKTHTHGPHTHNYRGGIDICNLKKYEGA